MMLLTKRNAVIFLLIILALAVFFRFWSLNSVPPGLYPDEAINGNDAKESLRLFYPENNGREGLFIWLLSFSFSIFGASIWALRIVPALIGTLTVLGLYFLTKEILLKFENVRCISLLSSFFLAVSFWHVNFSRIGFRAILVPFLLVFGFYFLFCAFRKDKKLLAAVSGIFLGLGFYTYISYRFVVLLILLALVVWFLYYKNEKRRFLTITLIAFVTAFIVALPIGIYFMQNPQDFFGRASGVSVFSQGGALYKLGKSVVLHLGMFNIYGDGNWRHNLAGSPQLLWPVGIFFLIGVILLIKELISGVKKKEFFSISIPIFLFSWFFIFQFPGFLSYEGIPHALRVIGVIPAVYIFAGFGAFWFFSKIERFFKSKTFFYFLIIVLLFSIGFTQFSKYFYIWGKAEEAQGAFTKSYVEIGRYIGAISDKNIYVIVNESGVPVPYPDGIPMPSQTIKFMENSKAEYLLPEQLDDIKGNSVVIPMRYDENLILDLYKKFPNSSLEEKDYFWVFNID